VEEVLVAYAEFGSILAEQLAELPLCRPAEELKMPIKALDSENTV
jgi:hypothetical protein